MKLLDFFKKVLNVKSKIFTSLSVYLSISIFILSITALNTIGISNLKSLFISLLLSGTTLFTFLKFQSFNLKGGGLQQTEAWAYTTSTLLTFFFARYFFEKANITLTNFEDRTIGIAVLLGIDISARTNIYVGIILTAILVFLFCLHIFSAIDRLINKVDSKKLLYLDKDLLFSFSSVSIFMLIFHFINGAPIFVSICDLFIFLTALTYTLTVSKIYFAVKDKQRFTLLTNYDLTVLAYIFPLVIIFLRWIYINGSYVFNYNYFYVYTIVVVIYWSVILILANGLKKLNGILYASVPFSLIPIMLPISNEIEYTISGVINTTPHKFSLLITTVLILLSLVNYLLNYRKNFKTNVVNDLLLPIFIITIVVFSTHTNFIELPNGFDMFHHGENLISTQQLLQYNKIPFINLYPTHGLSYLISQVAYALVNGYTAFSPWLWEWSRIVFEILLLYFVLRIVLGPIFSTLLIIFLPFIGIFGGQGLHYGYLTDFTTTYYFAPFLVGLLLIWTLKKPTQYRSLILWLSCFFLLLWRIDFGIASTIAAVFILVSSYISKPSSINVKIITKTLCVVFVICLLAFLVISKISGENSKAVVFQIIKFVTFQSQTQGLPTIASSFNPMSLFQYFVLPSISIIYVIFFLLKTIYDKNNKFGSLRYILLFIALFSLIISVRSVQRQSLAIIGYNPYLFVFLGFTLPFYVKGTNTPKLKIMFLSMLLGYQFVLPNNTLLIKSKRMVNPYDWKNKEQRVHVNENQYKNIAYFIKNNLENNQTFLDLTSSPLLYIATNKEFVNYLIPNSYITSETVQDESLSKINSYYNNNQLPLVIFRQKDNFANNIDGVPNEIRSYKIYEFIYSHYSPLGTIDGFNIWVKSGLKLNDTTYLNRDSLISQNYKLQKLPYYWGTYDDHNAFENSEVLQKYVSESSSIDLLKPLKIDITSKISNQPNYIALLIKSSNPGKVTLSFNKSSIDFDIIPSQKPEKYLVRVSSLYEWYDGNEKSVLITSSTKIQLIEVSLRKADQ